MATTVVVLLGVSAVALVGALCAFWAFEPAIKLRARGYTVRHVTRTDYTVWRPGLTDWLYEELTTARERRAFRVLREPISDAGYPQACRIYLPNAADWEAQTPSWARGRRDEIVARLSECFGRQAVFEDVASIEGRLCADTPTGVDTGFGWWWVFMPEALLVPFAIVAIGPWAAVQILSGRRLTGGAVLAVWLLVIAALARYAIRRRYFKTVLAVSAFVTLVLVLTAAVFILTGRA